MSKIVVSAVVLVIILSLAVYIVEMFLPLSAGIDFKTYCRNALLTMEDNGGLSLEASAVLEENLTGRGFTNISVSAPTDAGHGQEIILVVEADYTYSKLTCLFSRSDKIIHMIYDKKSICRRVVN